MRAGNSNIASSVVATVPVTETHARPRKRGSRPTHAGQGDRLRRVGDAIHFQFNI
jgi:hypothetical protein